MRRSGFLTLASVVFLALLAFGLRAVSLDTHSLWRDEVDAMRFATFPLEQVLGNFARRGWNGPLYFFLLRWWIALTGTSEYAMRFFSLWFGVLCVPLTYVLGRRLFDRRVGLLASLLVTTSPYLTWYGQEVKMYTLVPALVLLALYALRRALEGAGRLWWAVQIVATSLALYCHILAALLIPVQVLIALVWWPETRKRWRGALLSFLCLTLPYLPLAVWQFSMLFDVDGTGADWSLVQVVLEGWRAGNPLLLRTRVTGFSRFSLGQTVQILLDYWSIGELGTFGVGWPWGTLLMGGLAVWGLLSPLVELWRRKRAAMSKSLVLLFWLAFPPLAVWYVSQWQPLFTDRYFVWVAPAFYLLIALGLAVLWRLDGWWRWLALLAVGLLLGLNGLNQWQQVAIDGKADYRSAAAYVAARYQTDEPDEPAASPPVSSIPCQTCTYRTYLPLAMSKERPFDGLIVFQIPHARYTFDYYFPYTGYPWAGGLYTNHRFPDGSYMMSEANAASAMQEMTVGYDVIWLVATETWMWDERELVKAWLDGNARLTDEAHFKWVDVYRYER